MTAPMTEEAIARVEADLLSEMQGYADYWAKQPHKPRWAEKLPALLSLARQGLEMEEALLKAQHALITADNYRVTDLDVETFEAHLNNGVPRDRLEFMTDFSDELAVIDAALQSRSR